MYSTHVHADKHKLSQPVYGTDDEGDGGEADSCRGPLADGQGPLGGSAQQVERPGAHAVNGEARDHHRGEGLPHKRVHHCYRHPGRLPRVVPVGLWGQIKSAHFMRTCW